MEASICETCHGHGFTPGAPAADDDSGVVYHPWTDGWAVGFAAHHPDGRVQYVYLNPSGGSDDGVPTVFLYQEDDEPKYVEAVVHVALFQP